MTYSPRAAAEHEGLAERLAGMTIADLDAMSKSGGRRARGRDSRRDEGRACLDVARSG